MSKLDSRDPKDPDNREFFAEHGREGGKKLAIERGPEYMSEIGRRGRQKQLENQTPGENRPSKPRSEAKRKGVNPRVQNAAEAPNDPLLG